MSTHLLAGVKGIGLTVEKLLFEYFTKEQVQDALRDIGESTSGTKEELVNSLITKWKSYNHENYELLYFLDKTGLQMLCYHYNLDATPASEDVLIRRIKKADLLGPAQKIISQKNYDKNREIFAANPRQTVQIGQFKVSRKWMILTIISTLVTIVGIIVTIFYSVK